MKYILPLLLIILVASCRSARKISTALSTKDSSTVIVNPLESDSAKRVLNAYEKIKTNRIEFNTFTSKLVIDYKGLDKDGKERKFIAGTYPWRSDAGEDHARYGEHHG
jgi:hypothetical protein